VQPPVQMPRDGGFTESNHVTGVSAGLGVETARALAAHGAQVVGAARDLTKAERARAEVRAQAAKGGGLAEAMPDRLPAGPSV
jgi:NAD(P)-dependent dehydrogenase (short-subunit alcohol dehydrogenase family)